MSKLFRADRVSMREPLVIPLTDLPQPAPAEENPETAEREARRRAEARAQAKAQAERILRQTDRDAKTLYDQARREAAAEGKKLGRIRGERAGREYLDRQAAGRAEALRRCTARQEEALADVEKEVRRQATELAFALAGHILHAQIDSGASRFRRLEEETFAAASEPDKRESRFSHPRSAAMQKGDDAVA